MTLITYATGVAIGMIPVMLLLFRLTFQVGGLVREFGLHVKADDLIHADVETRMRRQEQRRR